jgi:hypothetical protein
VFGVPPSAVPREIRPKRPPAAKRAQPPPFDIDAVRLKKLPPLRRKR